MSSSFYIRAINSPYYRVVETGVHLILGAASTIGMLAGFTIWGAGLGDKIEEKARQTFSK